VIGYSSGASSVLTVILVEGDVGPAEHAEGDWRGANAPSVACAPLRGPV